jgi:hypothetical protein
MLFVQKKIVLQNQSWKQYLSPPRPFFPQLSGFFPVSNCRVSKPECVCRCVWMFERYLKPGNYATGKAKHPRQKFFAASPSECKRISGHFEKLYGSVVLLVSPVAD